MGIFTNDKKGCPICGNPTPRLFPTKVEGLPLCKECAAKINMEQSMLKNLTINELWDHLDYRKANSETFGTFTDNETHGMGNYVLHMDTDKRLFYIADGSPSNPALFKFEELVSFNLMEDGRTVIQCNKDSYSEGTSSIENYKLPPLKPFVKPSAMVNKPVAASTDKQPGRTSMAASSSNAQTAEEKPKAPDKPVDSLKLNVTLNNPYWKSKVYNVSLRSLETEDDIRPWVNDYKNTFAAAVDTCEAMAGIMGVKTGKQMMNATKEKAEAILAVQEAEAAAKEAEAAAQAAETAAKIAKAADDNAAIEMLRKWKELLDMGAITQEEFDAKKKEIIG